MIDTLFVYGTLMRSAAAAPLGRDMRARLEREASWLGFATAPGSIYDLGRYPVLVAPSQAADVVAGEVWRLAAPDQCFRWLDPYEGIPPGHLIGPEYQRVTERVTLAIGTAIEAWLYRYHAAVTNGRRLRNRWQPVVSPRPARR